MKETSDLWSKAAPLLLPYEGGASQIHVIELPLNTIRPCVRILHERTHETFRLNLDGSRPDSTDVQEFVQASTAHFMENKHIVLGGTLPEKRSLSAYLNLNPASDTFDAEYVFWADEFFPDPSDEAANRASFSDIVGLVEQTRSLNPQSDCALTDCETGDPRDSREKDNWVFW